MDPAPTKILVPTPALGTGVSARDVAAGVAAGAHVIACDAGSTDSGPAYLATGRAKYSREANKSDLAILMHAQSEAGIPLLIGSCGTSGCDMALEWTRDIAVEIATELGITPRIALLKSEQDSGLLAERAEQGRIRALAPARHLDPRTFSTCNHIVALMGAEPYMQALDAGADIVLGGRTTDTAVLAAMPLRHGQAAAACWHAGKIGECGALCTVDPRNGGILLTIDHSGFIVEPLAENNRCTPYSVSSHMLYENSDPLRLIEPGGILDVTRASYEALDERRVRVTGATFETQPYSMKLEGAGSEGFQTIMLVGIRDRRVLADIDGFVAKMHRVLTDRVTATMGDAAGAFRISLRPYGWNAVSDPEAEAGSRVIPDEIGLLFVATAETQAVAHSIAKTANPWFFHLPVDDGLELPSYAFPFSPAEIDRGPVYSFMLNHVVLVDDPLELVRIEFETAGEKLHATA